MFVFGQISTNVRALPVRTAVAAQTRSTLTFVAAHKDLKESIVKLVREYLLDFVSAPFFCFDPGGKGKEAIFGQT